MPQCSIYVRQADLYQPALTATRGGIPKVTDFRFDALIGRFALEEWCFGDSLGDYPYGIHGGWVAVVVGEMLGGSAGAPDSGFGFGSGWPVAVGGGGAQWDGPADFARLGASLQRGWH